MSVERCETCGWPLAKSREEGCVPGDCSYRGPPRRSADEPSGWRTIESAPKTSDTQPLPNYVLMYNGYHIGVGWRQMPDDPDFGPRFWSETGEPIEPPPTHWQPLPPPPEQDG